MAAKKTSQILVYGLLGLLIVGLAGFGATGLSGTVRTIGEVGEKAIPVDTYARELQQRIRAFEAEVGEPVTFAQAQALGIDRSALGRVVTTRALDAEAARLGLSIGDENLRDQVLQIPAFQSLDGSFDREGYAFALQNAGLSEAEFENQLREETARTLLQGAVISGVEMPPVYADTVLAYLAERRSFAWARMDQSNLDAPLPEPTEAELRAFHRANPDSFTLPETQRITYAWLLPDMIVAQMEIDETALTQTYQERLSQFVRPERRLVERLVFGDTATAEAAKAAIESGAQNFADAVAGRGLELADVDLGDVTEAQIGAAGPAVFNADDGAVVGPFDSDLGPALFRVNGVIAASEITFEQARPILREELAQERARRTIEAQAESINDLLAGGSTLEELANETDMELRQIDWYPGVGEDIAAYTGFSAAAAALSVDDFPEVAELDDGGIYAMRLDEVVAPRVEPFESVRDEAQRLWEAAETETRLRTKAETLLPQIEDGQPLTALGLTETLETEQTRRGFVTGTPAEFMTTVFDMEPGEARMIEGFGAVWIVRLDAITPPDPEDTTTRQLAEAIGEQAAQDIAQDIFGAYSTAVQLDLGVQLNQQAINAVHANFQ